VPKGDLGEVRIGIFALTVREEAGGGYTIERDIVDALAQESSGTRHELFLFSLRAAGAGGGSLPAYRIEPLGLLGSVSRATLAWTRFRSMLSGNVQLGPGWSRVPKWISDGVADSGADMVVCLTPGFLPTLNIPYFSIVWDLQHRLQPWFPEVSAGNEWIRRDDCYERVLCQASRVIVGTSVGKSEVSSFYRVPDENIRVLPYPTPAFALDAGRSHSSAAVEDRAGPRPYLFYPAQFWPHKDHRTALRALAVLKDRGLDLRLVFCGSNEGNRGWVDAEVNRLGLDGDVEFEGFVTRERLIALYCGALALVYPSWFGPDNLPPLEAFAVGCPVIAARVAGAQEQLGDAAVLFHPGDELSLARAIESVFSDAGLRKRLVDAGHDRARSFTPIHYARGLLQIIDEFEPARMCWARGASRPK
jgi:glycosyltransferase involved in cell wall biosynthesis